MVATSPPSRVNGPVVVQLGAYASEAQARAALSGLRPKLGTHGTRVESAAVNGKTWSRALVTGFADSAAASRFCATLKTQACFARAK